MFVSDITISKKCDRAAMYTILVNLKCEDDAADLASELEAEITPGGLRDELFVWRPSDTPTVVDVYTFAKATAEFAHEFLTSRATSAATDKAA